MKLDLRIFSFPSSFSCPCVHSHITSHFLCYHQKRLNSTESLHDAAKLHESILIFSLMTFPFTIPSTIYCTFSTHHVTQSISAFPPNLPASSTSLHPPSTPTSPNAHNEPLPHRPLRPRPRLSRIHDRLLTQRTRNLRALQPQRRLPSSGTRRRHRCDLRRGNQWRSSETQGPHETSAEFELEQGWQVSIDGEPGLEV